MANLIFAGDDIASTYEANIIAAGGTISFTHLAAVRAFIATGKAAGWWNKILDCCPFLGSNLAAALVKLKAAPGAGTSYVAHHGLVDIQYSTDRGAFVEGNGAPIAYIGTGFIPDQHTTSDNYSYGAGHVLLDTYNGGYNGQVWMGPYDTRFGPPVQATGMIPMSTCGFTVGFGWNRSYNAAVSVGRDIEDTYVCTGATDGIGNMEHPVLGGVTPETLGTMDLEIVFFKGSKSDGDNATIDGSVSFCFFGTHLTGPEIRSLTAAARQMHVSARQVVVGTHDVFIGDSITVGQGAANGGWAEVTMNARRLTEPHYAATNVAQSGLALVDSHAFPTRYTGTGVYPVTIYWTKMGANDCAIGNPVAAYKQYLIDMATALKALNTLTVIVTISYLNFTPGTPEEDAALTVPFVDAALEAAEEVGVLGVDTYRPMIDSGDPGQYLIDNIHLNSLGAQFVSDLCLDALATYRAL